jgi:hypothetical protein
MCLLASQMRTSVVAISKVINVHVRIDVGAKGMSLMALINGSATELS